ncbi:MAG: GGDEF domain-containing protein [Gemmatirosa sp.]|nr:GGDEF domain-containing protein [Gemmatirosa sp.]
MLIARRWLRRADTEPQPAPDAPTIEGAPANDPALGTVLDVVGTIVQTVGVFALDTDASTAADTRGLADRWRRHATTGLHHPGATDESSEPAAGTGTGTGISAGAGVAERDWTGLTRFVTERRRTEHEYVTRALGDLRSTVWTLVEGLHGVVGAERNAGQHSLAAVRRARQDVASASPDDLRGAALAVLDVLGQQLARRDQERDSQLDALGEQVRRLGAALEEAQREGARDALTGLGNRRALDDGIAHAVAMRSLWGQSMSLVVMDVDGLKALNDGRGHQAGDDALRDVASRLSRAFLRRTDVLCRFGGDEFAAVLRDTSLDQACRIATRVAVPPESDDAAADATPRLALSAGVAELREDETAGEWFARADAALYAVKRAGGGNVGRA